FGYTTGCVATPPSASTTTRTPVSSKTSRTTASDGCSPGSTIPAGTDQRPLSPRRTSNTRPPSSHTTPLAPAHRPRPSPISPPAPSQLAHTSGAPLLRPRRPAPPPTPPPPPPQPPPRRAHAKPPPPPPPPGFPTSPPRRNPTRSAIRADATFAGRTRAITG